jgi:PST family polysaccharide transporter
MGVSLFVGIWVARYLAPEQFGILSYALAFVMLFTTFSKLGLDNIVVRNLVKHPELAEETLSTAFMLKLVGGVLSLVISVGAVALLRPADTLTISIVAIIAVGMVFQSLDVIDLWFQSKVQSKYTVYAKNTAFLLASACKVGLILWHAPLIYFAWITLIEIAIAAVALVVVFRLRNTNLKRWCPKLRTARRLLKDSWPLILSGLTVMVYMRIDQIMLGEMLGANSVGIYSAAVRLTEAWYFIPSAIAISVFPSVIEAKGISEELYHSHLQKLYRLTVWLAIAIAIPVTIFSSEIISILYGANYLGAEKVLTIHVWTCVFIFLATISGQYLITENYTKISLLRTSAGAIVNVVLNLILIPKYGIRGAAVATLISQFTVAFFIIFIKKTRHQSFMMFRALIPIPIRKQP